MNKQTIITAWRRGHFPTEFHHFLLKYHKNRIRMIRRVRFFSKFSTDFERRRPPKLPDSLGYSPAEVPGGAFCDRKTPPEPSAAPAHGAKPWTTARNDPRTVRNYVRSPRWRFLRRRMPFRAAVHGFYAVGTHFALLVGGFYAVGTHSESSSAPSTPLALTPESPTKISTPLAQVTLE